MDALIFDLVHWIQSLYAQTTMSINSIWFDLNFSNGHNHKHIRIHPSISCEFGEFVENIDQKNKKTNMEINDGMKWKVCVTKTKERKKKQEVGETQNEKLKPKPKPKLSRSTIQLYFHFCQFITCYRLAYSMHHHSIPTWIEFYSAEYFVHWHTP